MVDDEFYDIINVHSWQAFRSKPSATWYARRKVSIGHGLRRWVFMHRVVMELAGVPSGAHTDHRDGDGLNNQILNLRAATVAQNQMNVGRRRDNSSGYKGVSFDKAKNKWVALITANGKRHYLGYHDTAAAAAEAYKNAALHYHGDFARF